MRRKRAPSRQQIRDASQPIKAVSPIIPKEVLDRIPEEYRGSVVEAAAFQGPLPPPSMFGQYDQVLPGSAGRIMAMAEKEQAHRIAWESRCLDAAARDTVRGQWMGFAVSFLCIGGAGAANLVSRFVGQRSSNNHNAKPKTG